VSHSDDSAIRDLTARFADNINRRDRDAFATLWWNEGIWELTEPYGMVASGLPKVLSMYDRLMVGWEFFAQLVHSGVVDIQGTQARSRWTMREVARGGENGTRSYDNLAIYDDTLEQRGGVWRFTKRRYCYIWVDDTTILGRSFPLPPDLIFEA
jgi:hypothetical protein